MFGAGIADVEPRSGSWWTAMPDLWQANRRGQRHATRSHSYLTAHDANPRPTRTKNSQHRLQSRQHWDTWGDEHHSTVGEVAAVERT